MFQFPRFTSATYVFSYRYHTRGGFPHSDICGSKPIAGSPQLFAGYHVLHRLLVPRHPPDALLRLIHFQQPDINSFKFTSIFSSFSLFKIKNIRRNQKTASNFFYPGYHHSSHFQRSYHLPQEALTTIHNKMVEVNGIEPTTSCLQSRRSTN